MYMYNFKNVYNFENVYNFKNVYFLNKMSNKNDTFDSIFICPSCHNVIINEIVDSKLIC